MQRELSGELRRIFGLETQGFDLPVGIGPGTLPNTKNELSDDEIKGLGQVKEQHKGREALELAVIQEGPASVADERSSSASNTTRLAIGEELGVHIFKLRLEKRSEHFSRVYLQAASHDGGCRCEDRLSPSRDLSICHPSKGQGQPETAESC